MGQVKGREPTPKQYPVQRGDRMQRTKPKGLCAFHTTRVKQISECTAESNKLGGNGKHVKAKKAMGSNGSGACTQGLGTTYWYLANTKIVGHRSKV